MRPGHAALLAGAAGVLGAAIGAGVVNKQPAPLPSSLPAPRDPAKVAAGILPRPDLTPGDTLAVSLSDLCRPGYAGNVRAVTEAEKAGVYRAYGITSRRPGQYEVDHLISLELGGSNDARNLWPQSYIGPWNAHIKDHLENVLHARVCAGEETLAAAQAEIAGDWTVAYRRYCGEPPGESERP